jgi:hypothetical protein
MAAAQMGKLDVMRLLVELGASTELEDNDHDNAFIASTWDGRYSTMQFLLEHADANVDSVSSVGATVWDLLHRNLSFTVDLIRNDSADLTALLRVMVLRGDPPPSVQGSLLDLFSPEDARVIQEGTRLRARLPEYLARRRALLNAHCPVLLPPLRALVNGYMELTTTDELWATGLSFRGSRAWRRLMKIKRVT